MQHMMAFLSKLIPTLQVKRSIVINPVYIQSQIISLCSYSNNKPDENNKTGGIVRVKKATDISSDVRPLGEKIKETTKTLSYTGVILAGVAFTGVIFFYIFRELFSKNSPNSIYAAALDKCKNDHRVEDALGVPIKGYGEETSRRRRTHVAHVIYEKEGVKHMRMKFHIKGCRNKATVELDMKQNDYGNYECRYLIVHLDDYSGKTFIIEDNRKDLDSKLERETSFSTLAIS